jgi:hypothetical protein
MNRKPPMPICKAFLVCRDINGEVLTLICQSNCYVNQHFPNGTPLAFFARLTGGHGEYVIEMQLQDKNGDVFWRNATPDLWCPQSPLATVDLVLKNYTPVFPGPGDYMLVLTANGEELGREPFRARLPSAVKQ